IPEPSTNSPTSTKSPTRNSVQVSCLRYAISASLPLFRQSDYRKITRENVADKDPWSLESLPVRLRNRFLRPGRPESAWAPSLPPPLRCRSARLEPRARLPDRNENSPAQNRPANGASPAAPSRHTHPADAGSA